MRVDHRGLHTPVAQKLLDGSDVRAGLEEMRGEGVTEGVAGDALRLPGADGGGANGALDDGFVQVVAPATGGLVVPVGPLRPRPRRPTAQRARVVNAGILAPSMRSLPLRPGIVLLLASISGCGPGEAPGPPNVLLISVDTLRADHLGCYGYERDTSPGFDRLARDGVVFENAMSTCPWTLPSHTSLLTGLYPAEHGVQEDTTTLGSDVPTLAGQVGEGPIPPQIGDIRRVWWLSPCRRPNPDY
jgi:hypothetical protein